MCFCTAKEKETETEGEKKAGIGERGKEEKRELEAWNVREALKEIKEEGEKGESK